MVLLFMVCLFFNFVPVLFCLVINTIANKTFSYLFIVSEGVVALKVPKVSVSLKICLQAC